MSRGLYSRPGAAAPRPYDRSRANRGVAFERVLGAVHALYKREKIAVIEKIPTPMRLIRWYDGLRFIGCFERKSTVDYQGYLGDGGRYVGVEAKQCSEKTKFKIDNIHDHQRDSLDAARRAGALAIVVVNMSSLDEYWAFPYEAWQAMESAAAAAGRTGSIPYALFKDHGVLCGPIRGIPGDYLTALGYGAAHKTDGTPADGRPSPPCGEPT